MFDPATPRQLDWSKAVDPEELPFDEYWSIETMRSFDPAAAHLWVEEVLTTCQRISAGIEI